MKAAIKEVIDDQVFLSKHFITCFNREATALPMTPPPAPKLPWQDRGNDWRGNDWGSKSWRSSPYDGGKVKEKCPDFNQGKVCSGTCDKLHTCWTCGMKGHPASECTLELQQQVVSKNKGGKGKDGKGAKGKDNKGGKGKDGKGWYGKAKGWYGKSKW